MKKYILLIKVIALVLTIMFLISSVEATSLVSVSDSSSKFVRPDISNQWSLFVPDALEKKCDRKNRDSESGSMTDEETGDKPEIRTATWNKDKDDVPTKAELSDDRNGDGDGEKDDEGDEKKEGNEKESEGFDRLWDVVTLG